MYSEYACVFMTLVLELFGLSELQRKSPVYSDPYDLRRQFFPLASGDQCNIFDLPHIWQFTPISGSVYVFWTQMVGCSKVRLESSHSLCYCVTSCLFCVILDCFWFNKFCSVFPLVLTVRSNLWCEGKAGTNIDNIFCCHINEFLITLAFFPHWCLPCFSIPNMWYYSLHCINLFIVFFFCASCIVLFFFHSLTSVLPTKSFIMFHVCWSVSSYFPPVVIADIHYRYMSYLGQTYHLPRWKEVEVVMVEIFCLTDICSFLNAL